MIISGIYCIESTKTGKKYIGSSEDILSRKKRHLYDLKNGKHHNIKLTNHVNKYGIEDLVFSIIEIVEPEYLFDKEQKHLNLIDDFDLYFNISTQAGKGGSDVQKNELLILDLKGNIVKEVDSGIDCARFLGNKRINYSKINTESISRKKYRIVTPYFYINNRKTISSWRDFSNKNEKRTIEYNTPKYKVTISDNEFFCINYQDIANIIGCSGETIRLQCKEAKENGLSYFKHPPNSRIKIKYTIELLP